MTYFVSGFALDLEVLKARIGIKDKPTRMQYRRRAEASTFHQGKDFSIGLSNFLIGPPYSAADYSSEASFLGYGLEAVVSSLGTRLANDEMCSCGTGFIGGVNDYMIACGSDLLSKLIFRGPPVPMPAISDFPSIGYLTADEVMSYSASLGALQFRPPPDGVSIPQGVAQEDTMDACGMLRRWVDEAATMKRGIVAFYY